MIRARRHDAHRRAERPGRDVPGVEFAIIEHDTVRHGVHVVPDNELACWYAASIRCKDSAPLIPTILMMVAPAGGVDETVGRPGDALP